MTRFRFNLEAVLKLRRFEEDGKKRALAQALRAVEAQVARIRLLESEREELTRTSETPREFEPAERFRLGLYLQSLEQRINGAMTALRSLEAAVLECRNDLAEAAKVRKAMERLKEIRREAFRFDQLRREYAVVDETVLRRLDQTASTSAS